MNKLIKMLIVAIAVLVITGGVLAVTMTDLGKVYLFSKMTGVIKLDGKPVINAKLVRIVDLSGPKVDETTTDQNGNFEFPVIFTRTITKHLPQEFVSNQSIIVHYQGKEYSLWSAVKRKPDENTESRGKPLVVACELNKEESMIKVNNSPIFSVCTWDVEPDKRPKAF